MPDNRPVVLTYAKDLEAQLVGEPGLCNDLPSRSPGEEFGSVISQMVSPSSMPCDTSR